jgi:aspartate-semialdehyde dehydrogenase
MPRIVEGRCLSLPSLGATVPGVESQYTADRVFHRTPRSFKDVDIALFSAGGSISKKLGPVAAAAGAVVSTCSSYGPITCVLS